MDLLERPPFGLDVVVLIGDVGVLHVRPIPDAIGEAFPFALILPNALLALLDEFLDAIRLDLFLAVQAELLFHLQLHRQAVRVPPGLAQDIIAIHRLIAREEVLDAARQHMADVRLAVGRRRTVIEGIVRLALPLLLRLFEDVLLFPKIQNLFLAGDEVQIR